MKPGTPLAVPPGLPRDELTRQLAREFPESAGLPGEPAAAAAMPWRGGRQAALAQLALLDPADYARTRNHVQGAVSRLSPWIRHGVLSLAEVRDAAVARAGAGAEKFVSELGWRDYWRQVHAALGDRILAAVEPPAATPRATPRDSMPADVLAAATGMACIDDFVRRLHETGWLHNHERMWLASWLVHVRGVEWRAGAAWFLSHLVDGDPASNYLSWQWVAGTFSAKPYLFNRENLETFTAGSHCRRCPVFGACDVEGGYDELAARCFAATVTDRRPPRIRPSPPWRPATGRAPTRPLAWLTLDAASPAGPALAGRTDRPALFVVDPTWLAAERPALRRLVFLFECLADVPDVSVLVGDPRTLVPARARALGCDGVTVADTPCPRVRGAAAAIAREMPVAVAAWPRFCDHARADDLGRFSRWWNRVRATALEPTARQAG
ncbi:MAG: FAD-binding domain-containing protein [Planctomycetaceae bacterium]